MSYRHPSGRKLRVSAVSYLNTVPLVWGMLHGAQRGVFDLEFSLPSECADRLASGAADIGIVPSAELPRLGLVTIAGAGIASSGRVRSILLISKVPAAEIRVLAVDTSSRTSVQLVRILLERLHRVRPRLLPFRPELDAMLASADAALIIGDPALKVDTDDCAYRVIDLGEAWTAATGLPMVYAVWAARPECFTPELAQPLVDSCRFGLEHIADIVRLEAAPRGLPRELVREYFERNVTLLLGEEERRGLELFLRWISDSAKVEPSGGTGP